MTDDYAKLRAALKSQSRTPFGDLMRACEPRVLQMLLDERDALEKKLSAARNRKPDGHCYRYPCPLGDGTVIRHNNGREVNGSDPIEVIPYWYGEPPTAPSPSYDALLIISQSVAAALERAGVTECDDPGDAIDLMRERLEAINLSAPKNQCDGCQAGHEVRNGLHVNERGRGYMVCQSSKYPDERKAMEKDAARYRWLRKHAADVWYGDHLIELIDTGRGALDSAVDAAMAGRKE